MGGISHVLAVMAVCMAWAVSARGQQVSGERVIDRFDDAKAIAEVRRRRLGGSGSK